MSFRKEKEFIINNDNIGGLVNDYLTNKKRLPKELRIPIGEWDVSNVTEMNYLFEGETDFNEPLNWNVSNVKSMKGMFMGASSFNSPLTWNGGPWDVSNVKTMHMMFMGASSFNQDIGNWDVSKVKDMIGMFQQATSFNQDLSHWNVVNVRNMQSMFLEATSFSINPNWRLNPRTNTQGMFDATLLDQNPDAPVATAPGRAFEIHSAFNNMNINKFMEIIKKENREEPLLKNPNKSYLKEFNNKPDSILFPLVEYILNNTIEKQKDEKINNISTIQQQIKKYTGYEASIPNIVEVLKFVLTQPTEYINLYIDILITDCMNAYNPGEQSCIKGMFERIFLANKDTILGLCTDEIFTSASASASASASTGLCKPIYIELYQCFYPDIQKLFQEWYEINNMDNGDSPLKNATKEERQNNFKHYVLAKTPQINKEAVGVLVDKYIKTFNGSNIFETLLLGGKKRSIKRKKNKKRKTLKKSLKKIKN